MCTFNNNRAIISEEEYRMITNDSIISNSQIREQVDYLESFCRNIVTLEIQKYYEQSEETI